MGYKKADGDSLMNEKIAVVEDEPDLLRLTAEALGREGFKVATFPDATSFLRSLDKTLPDLILLDLMLPDADGLDVCRAIRGHDARRSIPIIIMTAKGTETDRVLGLELGADDYVVKPVAFMELAARIRAVLRRGKADATYQNISLGNGEFTMDPERFEARLSGKPVSPPSPAVFSPEIRSSIDSGDTIKSSSTGRSTSISRTFGKSSAPPPDSLRTFEASVIRSIIRGDRTAPA